MVQSCAEVEGPGTEDSAANCKGAWPFPHCGLYFRGLGQAGTFCLGEPARQAAKTSSSHAGKSAKPSWWQEEEKAPFLRRAWEADAEELREREELWPREFRRSLEGLKGNG